MKKALRKDFWMEIRKTYTRFLSIFMIVTLGVAFYAGIQASSPDMRYSADQYFDEKALMDFKVQSTMGLTEDDAKAMEKLSTVEKAEPSWSTDVLSGEGEEQSVLHVESLLDDMNIVTVTEGKLPAKKGECLMDEDYMRKRNLSIGDTIEVEEKGDGLLSCKKFQITGAGSSPLYIALERGSSTLGSGEVSGFFYVTPESFDSEIYTQIYLQTKGAREALVFTEEYEEAVAGTQKQLEDIEEERCLARHDEVLEEAKEKIADAEKELADGKEEADEKLSDAQKKLEDGEKELSDGEKELADGKKQLEDAKKEVSDGKSQLADARKTYQDGLTKLSAGRQELNNKQLELNKAKKETTDGRSKLNEAMLEIQIQQKEIDNNQRTLDEKQEELNANKTQLEESEAQLTAKEAELTQAKAELPQQEAQLQAAEAQLAQGEKEFAENASKETELKALQEQLAQAQAQLDGQKAQAQAIPDEQLREQTLAQLEQAQKELDEQKAQVEAGLLEIEKARTELAAARAEVENGRQQLENGKKQISEGEKQLEEGKKQISEGKKQLADGQSQIDAAQKKIDEGQKKLDKALKPLKEQNEKLSQAEKQVSDGQLQIDNAKVELDKNQALLDDASRQIRENEQKLADGEKEIEENEKKLEDAEKEIEDAKKELADGRKEYEDAKADAEEEIKDGERKIAEAKQDLKDLENPEWIISDRDSLSEYTGYGDNALRMKKIGEVFPVLFFLVAALVSLTTMTRMVEEQRTQIGTLKALGYSKGAIISKYLLYAASATVGGSLLGVLLGEKLLPYIIINAYGILYTHMPVILVPYELKYSLLASLAALGCTVLATLSSCYKELLETPASLMRPPAPKAGKRVLLERIPFLWNHISFTWKSTIRNLFRYKKRFFMTVFGISGCMALLLVGFGLRDSIMDVAILQYSQIQKYDGIIIFNEDASGSEKKELHDYLDEEKNLPCYTDMLFQKMEAKNGKNVRDVYLYVPQDVEKFESFVTFRDRITHEEYHLTDEGVILSEKTAKMLEVKKGDTMIFRDDGKKERKVKIKEICENYMLHYVYMTPNLYKEIFGVEPDYNSASFVVSEEYKDRADEIGHEILDREAALSINYTSNIEGQLDDMLSTLDSVIIVLIVSAGLLAFVVLYNLNNISITERKRELATLKVLGFYDKETSAYVFRENIILTAVGILVGMVLGYGLHQFIITTVEVDVCMFGRIVKPVSYLYCALFTVAFSLFVNGLTHFKLKKIDMVESLKSVE